MSYDLIINGVLCDIFSIGLRVALGFFFFFFIYPWLDLGCYGFRSSIDTTMRKKEPYD